MRAVHGVSEKDLSEASLVEIGQCHRYRLPSPLRLLKAKVANVRDRPQVLRFTGACCEIRGSIPDGSISIGFNRRCRR